MESGLKHKGKSHQPNTSFFTEQSIELSMAVSELFLSILYLCHVPAKSVPHQHLTHHFASSRRNKEPFLVGLSQIPFSSNLKAQTFHSKRGYSLLLQIQHKKEQGPLCFLLAHLPCICHQNYIVASTGKSLHTLFHDL